MKNDQLRAAAKHAEKQAALEELKEMAELGKPHTTRRERRKGKEQSSAHSTQKSISLEKIVKQTLDNYVRVINDDINNSKARPRQNPKDGQWYTLTRIDLHMKLEEFEITAKELSTRFAFKPEQLKKQIFTAFQLAVFKEITVQQVEVRMDKNGKPQIVNPGWAPLDPDPSETEKIPINKLKDNPRMQIMYHAFYPIITDKDTPGYAKEQLYQGYLNTVTVWGFQHQEHKAIEVKAKEVEENREKINEKLEEFNKAFDFDPEENEQ